MQKKTYLSLILVAAASTFGLWDAATALLNPDFAANLLQAQEPQEAEELPLILSSVDGEEEPQEEEAPILEFFDEEEDEEVETLPPPAILERKDAAVGEIPPYEHLTETDFTEEEMEEISTRPLFREFANTVGEVAPLPEELDVESFDVPGAALIFPEQQIIVDGQTTQTSIEEATRALDEVLEIANVDLGSLEISERDHAALTQLDAEIQRLYPLWIDAELNRTTIGRRELNWKQPGYALYSTADPEPVDAYGSDWAMAPDAPFFFQVVNSLDGECYYTKAGDFEQFDPHGFMAPALIRGDQTFVLTVEPGKVVPTGRAERIRVRKDGQVQGTDVSGKLVTDVHLGNVPLFVFDNPARLYSEDGVFFAPTPYSGEPKQAKLNAGTKIGVTSGKVLLSNGKPEEIFARIVVLCKSKKRLVEILSQPRLQ